MNEAASQQPELTPEMVRALRCSGYLMESRVNRVLRKADWYVDANNYIPDPATGKPRESDLVAQLLHTIGPGLDHCFSNVIAIECINNDLPVVFMSRVPDDPARVSQYFRMGGFPRTIDVAQDPGGTKSTEVDLPLFLGLQKSHRFIDLPAYDMYCTFARRKQGDARHKGELRADHPDDWHGTFQKVLHVREYFQQMYDRKLVWAVSADASKPRVWITHYHHLVVFKGPLVALNQPDGLIEGGELGDVAERRPHLLYRRTEGKGMNMESTMVDVIVEDYLPEFLKVLEKEAEHFCSVLAGNMSGLLSRVRPDASKAFLEMHAKDPNFGEA